MRAWSCHEWAIFNSQSLTISCSPSWSVRWARSPIKPPIHAIAIDDPPAATMPRQKKYDWSDKKDVCYRLWVEEEKSLPQVQEYFAQALGVAEGCIPS
jgi:hypothetical protein